MKPNLSIFEYLTAFSLALLLSSINVYAGFVYTLNDGGNGIPNKIYGYSVNETTGALNTLAGFPILTGGNGDGNFPSERMIIDRSNLRLYAVNDGSNSVSAFSINPITGELTSLPFSPITLPNSGIWSTIAVHPTGTPLIVGDYDIINPKSASYVITATTATAAEGSPFSTGTAVPASSVFSREGNYFYTGGNDGRSTFAGFSVNSVNGVLTALTGSPYDSGEAYPGSYATDSQGRLFMAHFNNGSQLRVFTTSAGVPVPVVGNPFISGLNRATDGAIHPNEMFYAIVDRLGAQIGIYRINGTGTTTTLTSVIGSPFASGGSSPNALIFNQTGTFLFAENSSSRNITTYSFNTTTGEMTNVNIQPLNSNGTSGRLVGIDYLSRARVRISGRVTNGTYGLPKVTITLTNSSGQTQKALTSSFGYFQFFEVEAGETYVVTAKAKGYEFQSQTINVTGNVTDINFYPFGM